MSQEMYTSKEQTEGKAAHETIDEKTSIADLEKYQNTEMTELNLKTILGTEGISSRVFFKIWFADLDWKGRKPRAKIDKTNVILDIGYTYLFNIMEGMLNLYGFDVYKGIYHQSFYQRKSIVDYPLFRITE